MRPTPRARCLIMVSVCALGCGSRTALDDSGGASSSRGANCAQTGLTVLASAQVDPSNMVLDATHVYWNTHGPGVDGSVMRVSKCGGAPITLASVPDNPFAIAVDETSVYWTSYSGLMKMALAGGAVTTLAATPWISPVYALALDATSLYWATGSNIMKTPIDGSSTIALLPTAPENIGAIVVDSTSVYWSDLVRGAVMRMPLGGGTPTTLVAGLTTVTALAVDATSVYWIGLSLGSGNGSATVMKVPLAGGTPTTLAAGQNVGIWPYNGIAVDANNVYWTNPTSYTSGAVMKVALNGGTPITLATSDQWDTPAPIAVDETSVYWLTTTEVMKLTPK